MGHFTPAITGKKRNFQITVRSFPLGLGIFLPRLSLKKLEIENKKFIGAKTYKMLRLAVTGSDRWCYHWVTVRCVRCGWECTASITPYACIVNSVRGHTSDDTGFTVKEIPIAKPGTFHSILFNAAICFICLFVCLEKYFS